MSLDLILTLTLLPSEAGLPGTIRFWPFISKVVMFKTSFEETTDPSRTELDSNLPIKLWNDLLFNISGKRPQSIYFPSLIRINSSAICDISSKEWVIYKIGILYFWFIIFKKINNFALYLISISDIGSSKKR